MIPVTGLNHAVLHVRDLDRSVQFYKSVFGFVEVDRMRGIMAFLRSPLSRNHHDLGLLAVGSEAASPPRGAIGLYHLAWEVKKIEDLAIAIKSLKDSGYYQGASDHGAIKSVYGQDPDGQEFEITWVVPREDWGEFEERAIVAPLNLTRELERYGEQKKPTPIS